MLKGRASLADAKPILGGWAASTITPICYPVLLYFYLAILGQAVLSLNLRPKGLKRIFISQDHLPDGVQ